MGEFRGCLPMAESAPAVAAAVAFGLALLAAWTARQMALSLHAQGLRASPPPPLVYSLGAAVLVAGVAAAAAQWLPPGPWRAALLGAVFGHSTLDLANNARAGAALRAVAGTPGGVAAWLQVPPQARLETALAAQPAVITMLAVACLLRPEPGLLGFLAGALVNMIQVRRHGQRQLESAFRELAEQVGVAPTEPAPRAES